MSVATPLSLQAQDALDHERVQRVLAGFPVRVFIPSEFLSSIDLEEAMHDELIDRIRGPRADSVTSGAAGLVDVVFYLKAPEHLTVNPAIKVRYKKRRAESLAGVWSQEFKKAERQAIMRMFKIQRKFMMFKLKKEIYPWGLREEINVEASFRDLQSLMVSYRETCQSYLKLKILNMYASRPSAQGPSLPQLTVEAWSSWVEGQVFYTWMVEESSRYYDRVSFSQALLSLSQMVDAGLQEGSDESSLQSEIDATFEEVEEERFQACSTYSQRKVDDSRVQTIEAQDSCCICMENELFVLPCGHKFHTGCLNSQVQYSNECPMCRAQIPIQE